MQMQVARNITKFMRNRVLLENIFVCSHLKNRIRFNKIATPEQLFCAKFVKYLYKFTLGAIIYIVII